MRLHLADDLATIIIAAAVRDYPRECCGLIEGNSAPDGWRVTGVHETSNLAREPEHRFEIDPAAHFTLLRALRGSGRHILGCFHSHPDGAPEPSETDHNAAAEDGFLWLIAGGTPADFSLRAYCFNRARAAFDPVTLPH